MTGLNTGIDRLVTLVRGYVSAELGSNTPDWDKIKSAEERLRISKSLKQQFAKQEPRWVFPVMVALGSSCLIALASLVHPSSPQIQVEASVTALRLESASRQHEATGSLRFEEETAYASGGKLLTSRSIENVRRAILADALTFAPSTVIELSAIGKRCHRVIVKQGTLTAQLTMAAKKASRDEADPDQLVLPKGGYFRFCLAVPSVIHTGAVSAIKISKGLRNPTPPEIEVPSLIKGSLRVLDTASTVVLKEVDRVSLVDVSESASAIELSETLQLWFSGRVARPTIHHMLGLETDVGTDITPSLLDLAISSPGLTKLFAAVSGLTTLLLGLRKWFVADKQ